MLLRFLLLVSGRDDWCDNCGRHIQLWKWKSVVRELYYSFVFHNRWLWSFWTPERFLWN